MKPPIDFYFDFSSPYGYFAANRIEKLAAKHGRGVTWKPILLGAVFKVTQQQPLSTIPVKGTYAQRDFERTARRFGLQWKLPTKFPISTIAPARAFYWLNESDPERAKRFALAIYHAYFAQDLDISSTDVVLDVASGLGIGRQELERAMNDQAIKDKVRAEVDTAVSRGVFGSPFIMVDGEPFWGSDRLDHVDDWLAKGGW